MAIHDVVNTALEGIKDLSELNVRTFRGDLKSIVKDADGNWEEAISSARASGTIELVALTTKKIDGDVDQYFSSGDIPAALSAAHSDAVESGTKSREAIINFAKNIFRKD